MGNTNNYITDVGQSLEAEAQLITEQELRERTLWHMEGLDPGEFKNWMMTALTMCMAKRGHVRPYVLDEYNRDILNQMYKYIICSSDCRWDLNKGLYLGGKVGVGKTLLMQAFTHVLGKISGYFIEMISARQLSEAIRRNGLEYYIKRPLFVDELGRENLEENLYGRQFRPFEELVSSRYEYGKRLFITSNFKPERLAMQFNDEGKRIGYGQYIYDRLRDCCTFEVLEGENKRGTV